MKKVVSVALFGDSEHYRQFVRGFVRAHANLFRADEGWELRVHVDGLVDGSPCGKFLRALEAAGLLTVRLMQSRPLTAAMLWRLAPVFEEGAGYVFCRDVDSCPTPRDRAVCDQFMRSERVVHTIHDSISHIGVMGGLCGFLAPEFVQATGLRSLDDVYAFVALTDAVWARHGTDQHVLNWILVQSPHLTLLEHRHAGWGAGRPGVHPPRSAGRYPCAAWSVPVPDIGISHLAPEDAAEADRLGQHLGSAGFDVPAVAAFWDEHGDPEVTCVVAECERDTRAESLIATVSSVSR